MLQILAAGAGQTVRSGLDKEAPGRYPCDSYHRIMTGASLRVQQALSDTVESQGWEGG